MTAWSEAAADAAIYAASKALGLPIVRAEAGRVARQRLTHKAFLAEVLSAECDDRDARPDSCHLRADGELSRRLCWSGACAGAR